MMRKDRRGSTRSRILFITHLIERLVRCQVDVGNEQIQPTAFHKFTTPQKGSKSMVSPLVQARLSTASYKNYQSLLDVPNRSKISIDEMSVPPQSSKVITSNSLITLSISSSFFSLPFAVAVAPTPPPFPSLYSLPNTSITAP